MGKDRRHEKNLVSSAVVGDEVPVGFGEVTIPVLPNCMGLPRSANEKAAG